MPRCTTDKNFGRSIAKLLIVKCVKIDLKILGGDQQLCMSQKGGIEHAIHSLRAALNSLNSADPEAILLIDAKNAFNILNRNRALRNIEKLCSSPIAIVNHQICFLRNTTLSRRYNTRLTPCNVDVWNFQYPPIRTSWRLLHSSVVVCGRWWRCRLSW